MNFSSIRIVNSFIQFFLALAVILQIYQKLGKPYAYAFALTLLLLNPISTALCLQFTDVYYIMLITLLLMLRNNPRLKLQAKYYYLFMFNGVFVAFFDFLTYPFVALGIPTVFYLLLNTEGTAFMRIKKIIKLALSWGLGYLGMWAGKWGVAYLLTGQNVLISALNALQFRVSGELEGKAATWWWALKGNLYHLFQLPIVLLGLGVLFVILYYCIFQ